MVYISPPNQRNTARHFNEILFSANVGFAVAYALYAYEGCSRTAVNAPESIQKLLEAFVQVLRRFAPLTVHVRSHSQLMRSAVIYEITFIVVLCGISLGFYALARSLRQWERARILFVTISGVAALAAVPIFWLSIVRATWFDYEGRTFWEIYGYLSVLEIVVAGTLLYLLRNRVA